MGIESEQLVFDYLSRIGDLAHRTSMSAADRARLVADLRGTIDHQRTAAGGAHSPAEVKKILAQLGKPEDVVAAAGGHAQGDGQGTAQVPRPRADWGQQGAAAARAPSGPVPGQRATPPPAGATTPPHLASQEELGPQESDLDWWRVNPSPYGTTPLQGGPQVRGFFGGIEVPEMLHGPAPAAEGVQGAVAGGGIGSAQKGPAGGGRAPRIFLRKSGAGATTAPGAGAGGAGGPGVAPGAGTGTGAQQEAGAEGSPTAGATGAAGTAEAARQGRKRQLVALVRRRVKKVRGGPAVGGIVEWLAVIALLVGAVLGQVLTLGIGWALAYWSPRLSRNEAKWALMGVPGVVTLGGLVWLWGRTADHWGDPLAGSQMREAVTGVLPVLLKVAAVASALFLVWRARRRKE